MSDSSSTLLVVQPSGDYARRVLRHFTGAVFVATPARAALLPGCDNVVAADLADAGRTADEVARFLQMRGIRLSGITCFVCEYLPVTAALARALGLSYHSKEAVRVSRRKDLAHAAWSAHGVPTPETTVIGAVADLRAFAHRVPGPWILKPKQGTGSAFVLKVGKAGDLEAAHRTMREGLAESWPEEMSYLAQKMVGGTEVSADFFVDGPAARPLRLTEKCLAVQADTAGVVQAYYPSRRPREERDLITAACLRGARALRVARGIVMADVMLTADGPVLLEMGLRPGGDCLPDMSLHATGYDPVRAAGLAALGVEPEASNLDSPAPVAALHLMARHEGRIASIDFSALDTDPRVIQYEPYHTASDTLRVWKGSYDDRILAACVVRCADATALPGLADELAGKIRMVLSGGAGEERRGSVDGVGAPPGGGRTPSAGWKQEQGVATG